MEQIIEKMVDTENISEFLSLWLDHNLLSFENKKIFDRYYHSYKYHFGKYIKHYYKRQTKELMEILNEKPHSNILEIGCGCGTESLWMALHGANVTAIDISEILLNAAKERQQVIENKIGKPLPLKFKKESITEINPEIKYDIVWMEQAFHHLEPRKEVLKILSEIVLPGGYLIMSETNAWNPLIQFKLFQLRGFKTIVKGGEYTYGDERIITPSSLKRKLKQNGFSDIKYKLFRLLPNKKWADIFKPKNINIPIPFMYTHYNIVAKMQN